MNIAMITWTYPPYRWAGADVFNEHLANALAAAGHQVTVHTTNRPPAPYTTRTGVKVTHCAGIMGTRADVVITAPDVGDIGPNLTRRPRGGKLVGIVHNTSPRTTQLINRHPWDLLVWNANATRQAHNGDGGLVCRPPVVMPDENHAHGDAVTLVNLSEAKGAHTWWRLAEAFPDREFLGVPSWGPQVRTHPDGADCPNVPLLDPIPPPEMCDALWARTSILLAPSEREAWGMAAVEALAHRIPVIAHPTDGLLESLGDAGRYADRDHLEQWAAHLQDITKRDRDRAHARALQLAEQTITDTAAFVAAVEGLA